MRKVGLLAVMTIVSLTWVLSQKNNSSFSARWQRIDEYAAKQLPESALKEVEGIWVQAQKNQDSVQMVKALMYKMRFTLEKDPDQAPVFINEFETFTNQTTDPSLKALLHSMIAELYANYYQKDRSRFDSRSETKGSAPDDMNEWTRYHFIEKVTFHLSESLKEAGVLQRTDALHFGTFVNAGEDSRTLQPTLFDLLMYRKIKLLSLFVRANNYEYFADNETVVADTVVVDTVASIPDSLAVDTVMVDTAFVSDDYNGSFSYDPEQLSDSVAVQLNREIELSYQQLIDFNRANSNFSAMIYAELELLQFNYNRWDRATRDNLYLQKLLELENLNKDNEAEVEVLFRKANYYHIKSLGVRNYGDDSQSVEEISPVYKAKCRRMAYDICAEGIKKFPNYKRIGLLVNLQNTINRKMVSVHHNNTVKPASELKVSLNYSNIDTVSISVYRLNMSALEFYKHNIDRNDDKKDITKKTLLHSFTLALKKDSCFSPMDTVFTIKTASYGIYEVCVEDKHRVFPDEISKTYFTVTDLFSFHRNLKPRGAEIYVTDRMSGQLNPGVALKIYSQKWQNSRYLIQPVEQRITDAKGHSITKINLKDNNGVLFFQKGADRYFIDQLREDYNYEDEENPFNKAHISVFTDRMLYRPGQTVYFKGIAYVSDRMTEQVIANKEYQVELEDANERKVGSVKVKTNEFGSFAGNFVLPSSCLSGDYSFCVDKKQIQDIRVEEYKRPTFEVSIDRPKNELTWNADVFFKGKVRTFFGAGVPNARVKYSIERSKHHFWGGYSRTCEVAKGMLETRSDGSFEIKFLPTKNTTVDQVYTYTVSAEVTNASGETQTGEQTCSVGDQSLFINMHGISETINKDSLMNLTVEALTLNDEKISANLSYKLSRLKDTTAVDVFNASPEDLKVDKVMASGNFISDGKKFVSDVSKFESGYYRLEFATKDHRGHEVKKQLNFVLYSLNDRILPVKSDIWLKSSQEGYSVGDIAKIQFGTSARNALVLYEIIQGNKVLMSRWISCSNEVKTFNVPFLKQYGDGVVVQLSYVKNEHFFTASVDLVRKSNQKKLTPSLSVFRDKIQPGAKETWTVTVPEIQKNKLNAELLVGMYDASLDAINAEEYSWRRSSSLFWDFSPQYVPQLSETLLWNDVGNDTSSKAFHVNPIFVPVNDFAFDQLNWFGFIRYPQMHILQTAKLEMAQVEFDHSKQQNCVKESKVADVTAMMSLRAVEPPPPLKCSVKFTAPVIKEDKEIKNESDGVNTPSVVKAMPLRSNFNETAFFYPQLRTDSVGNVKFTFTTPESLTRWNVKMLAHTRDLWAGQGEAQVLTQKDLMVQLNLPRFVRRSDKLVLCANVINLTDKKLNADVVFEMMDPATEKPILLHTDARKKVALKPNETQTVQWELTEFSPFELVICKVTAQSGIFSDGEQRYLPVLSDKVLLTESLPLTVRGNQERQFEFSSLINNAAKVETKNLSVEFSTNPAWYAVQALPTLAEPASDDAIDLFTAFYAHTLATYMANSTPRISQMFDRWKTEGSSREALISNLQKNSELKNVLLEETPWVMAAQNESEQKKQIALLFDVNNLKNKQQQYWEKLLKLQLPSGGFSWYAGMPESPYITQEILLNLGRLNRLTGNKWVQSHRFRISNALKYLDAAIEKDFKTLKKRNANLENEPCIDDLQLFYLHVRSEFSDFPIEPSAVEAVKYYTRQAEKYWTHCTLYGKAMMAVVAQRNGNTQLASAILSSLKENALKTDELGMYWAKNTPGYWWNERPVAVQAAIIEAFNEITHNSADLDELKIWLLKQKQTQCWDSPMATVDAIHALLTTGSDWLSGKSSVEIKVGNKVIKPVSTEPGTGYFKQTIPVADFTPAMGKLTVSSTNAQATSITVADPIAAKKSNIGWGAMYWQYFQDVDKVKGQSGAFKVSKKLFVEKSTADGLSSLTPIDQTSLKKGDKVITRLVVTTDRNLEFVALKDLRAACFEPLDQLSGYEWKDGVVYYRTTKDASTQFFFSFLPKGTYVLEYPVWVNNSGTFVSGITTIQCQYAPEFVSHSGGEQVVVK